MVQLKSWEMKIYFLRKDSVTKEDLWGKCTLNKNWEDTVSFGEGKAVS